MADINLDEPQTINLDEPAAPAAAEPGFFETLTGAAAKPPTAAAPWYTRAAGMAPQLTELGGKIGGTPGRAVGAAAGAAGALLSMLPEAGRSAGEALARPAAEAYTQIAGAIPPPEGAYMGEPAVQPSEAGRQAAVEALTQAGGETASWLTAMKGPALASTALGGAATWLSKMSDKQNLVRRWVHDLAPGLGLPPAKLERLQAGQQYQERLIEAFPGVKEYGDHLYTNMRTLGEEHAVGLESATQNIRTAAAASLKWIREHAPAEQIPDRIANALEELSTGVKGADAAFAAKIPGGLSPDVIARNPQLAAALGVAGPKTMTFSEMHAAALHLDQLSKSVSNTRVEGGVGNLIGKIRAAMDSSVVGTPAEEAVTLANSHWRNTVKPLEKFVAQFGDKPPEQLYDRLAQMVKSGNVTELNRLSNAVGEPTQIVFRQRYLKALLDDAKTVEGQLDYKKLGKSLLGEGDAAAKTKLFDGQKALWGEELASNLRQWAGDTQLDEKSGKAISKSLSLLIQGVGMVAGWYAGKETGIPGGTWAGMIGGRYAGRAMNTEFLSRVLMNTQAVKLLRDGADLSERSQLPAVLTRIAAEMPPPQPERGQLVAPPSIQQMLRGRP